MPPDFRLDCSQRTADYSIDVMACMCVGSYRNWILETFRPKTMNGYNPHALSVVDLHLACFCLKVSRSHSAEQSTPQQQLITWVKAVAELLRRLWLCFRSPVLR